MPAILLVRHGQASFGSADYDRLSPVGSAQAALLADELAQQDVSIVDVRAGAMTRQQQTAAPIAAAFSRQLTTDQRLDEYDSSDILAAYSESTVRMERTVATTSAEFQAILDPALATWIESGTDGPAGESFPAFADRTLAAVHDAAATLDRGETAVLATSGGVIAAVCAQLLGLPDLAFIALNRVALNAGITKLIVGRRGVTLVSYNEHRYLERTDRSLLTYR